jgi:CubicO group peptidase (beta-lactamase class C family)
MFNNFLSAKSIFIKSTILASLALYSIQLVYASSTQLNDEILSTEINKALSTFNTPGMAVGITYQGENVHLEGYGMRDLKAQAQVDKKTYFRLASTSKAFTAASLAILVDEEKLKWDDKVIDHLPEFRMMDPWVTAEFTIRDLLSHRSGLVSSAGDSMIWPEPSGFSRAEMVHNLRYLTPEYSFRSTYAYNNIFYITAAEIVSKVTNMPWEDFVSTRIFKPLNMKCYAGEIPSKALKNKASAYGYNQERGIYPIPRNGIKGKALISAAAGGIVCNASDMLKWLNFLLTLNEHNEEETNQSSTQASAPNIFSAQRLKEMWSPNTILNVSKNDQLNDGTQFRHYAMGWQIKNINGYRVIYHTGTLSGYQAYVTLVPELELGVVLLNNGSNSGARSSVMETIIKSIMPQSENKDWVETIQMQRETARQKYLSNYEEVPDGSGTLLLAKTAYSGQFTDQWFGSMLIEQVDDELRIKSERMLTLTGTLEPYEGNSFVIRWDNKNAARDTFIHFDVDPKHQVKGFSLEPFTVKVSKDHEYRDMYFQSPHIED